MCNYFTDASYSPTHNIGILGTRRENGEIVITRTENMKNTQCELESFVLTLEYALSNNDKNIIIFTDCSNVCRLVHERNDSREKRYKDFYKRYDHCVENDMIIDVRLVKGHSPQNVKTECEKLFCDVDKKVRKVLRETVDMLA